MTVNSIDPETHLLECIWFDEKENNHKDYFQNEVLEAVSFQDDFDKDFEELESDPGESKEEETGEVTEEEEGEDSNKSAVAYKKKKK